MTRVSQAIRRCAVDAFGLPIALELTGGEVHDCKAAPEFIGKLPASEYRVTDKGYDRVSSYLFLLIKHKGFL